MDRRLLGNILLILLLILIGSGMLMYLMPFDKRVASIHTFFAMLFILAMVFHIVNNKKPLKNYIVGKRLSKLNKLQFPLFSMIAFLLTLGLYFNISVLNDVYAFGNEMRNSRLGKIEKSFDFQIITLDNTVGDRNIGIELQKGDAFKYPLFAVWIENIEGEYIQTLYISRVISSSTFDYGNKVNGKWEPALIRRPESLPYWSHKRGIQATDGLYIPMGNSEDIDAYSGATPTGSFIINSRGNFSLRNYRIMLEVNQSYDWNEYYTKDKFPNDKIYSGSGQVGQPSLIYAAEVIVSDFESTKYYVMDLIGHGHHSGADGTLYKDLSHITTAKQIAERIIISVD